MAWFQSPSATSWAMVRIPVSWCTASNRSPEEHCSTPVPHHSAGGRLSLDGTPPGEQGSIPSQRSGSGMDPPGFWAGNTGKSPTTHPVSPGQSTLKRCKGEQSGRMGQSAYCQAARSEWPFRFQPQPPAAPAIGAGTPTWVKGCPAKRAPRLRG